MPEVSKEETAASLQREVLAAKLRCPKSCTAGPNLILDFQFHFSTAQRLHTS